jgi:hypothetical protein
MRINPTLLILIILAIASLSLMTAGCSPKQATPEQPKPVKCSDLTTYDLMDSCYLERMASENVSDPAYCDKIIDETKQDDCLYKIFNLTKDTVNCSNIDENRQDVCYMVMGIEKIFVPNCYKIIDLSKRDQCYYRIAMLNAYPNDIQVEICNKIDDDTSRANCLAIISSPLRQQ